MTRTLLTSFWQGPLQHIMATQLRQHSIVVMALSEVLLSAFDVTFYVQTTTKTYSAGAVSCRTHLLNYKISTSDVKKNNSFCQLILNAIVLIEKYSSFYLQYIKIVYQQAIIYSSMNRMGQLRFGKNSFHRYSLGLGTSSIFVFKKFFLGLRKCVLIASIK